MIYKALHGHSVAIPGGITTVVKGELVNFAEDPGEGWEKCYTQPTATKAPHRANDRGTDAPTEVVGHDNSSTPSGEGLH